MCERVQLQLIGDSKNAAFSNRDYCIVPRVFGACGSVLRRLLLIVGCVQRVAMRRYKDGVASLSWYKAIGSNGDARSIAVVFLSC